MWWIAGFYAEPYSYVVLPRPDSKPANPIIKATLSSGNGLMRPLEAAAKKASVQISIEHKMTGDALVGSEPSLWGLYNQTGQTPCVAFPRPAQSHGPLACRDRDSVLESVSGSYRP
jgi:hypothetical protein